MLTFPALIRGGSGINVVPGSYEAYGDVRLLPGTSPEEIKRLITEQLERFSIPIIHVLAQRVFLVRLIILVQTSH